MSLRSMRPLPLLLALAASLAAGPRPQVEAQNLRSLKAGNVCDTFLGEVDGRAWFFKADGPTEEIQRYGNFEAEVIVSRIMARLGILAPRARVVELSNEPGKAFLQVELVDKGFTGGGRPVALAEWMKSPDLARIEAAEVRLIQVVDVLIGNGDRHDGNLFVVEMPDGRTRVVPIDNNLALATPRVVLGYYNWHMTRGLTGVVPGRDPDDPGDLLYPKHAPACGTPPRLMRRNQLYEAIWWQSGQGKDQAEEYARAAEQVTRTLDDASLAQIVGELPDADITLGDPAARKHEILELLRRRRDQLPRWFRTFSVAVDGRAQVGKDWLQKVLPASLRARLALSERAWAFLLQRMFDAERFVPTSAYADLRAAGVEKLLARQAVALMCKEQGVPFPLKEVAQAEGTLASSGYAQALTRFWDTFPTNRFEALHGTVRREAGPVRFLSVRAEAGRVAVLGPMGKALDPASVEELKSTIQACLRQAGATPGRTLLMEYDPFAPAGRGPAYQLTLR